MDRHFPILEHGRRKCRTCPDGSRVTRAGKDRCSGRLVQFGGRAAVVDVAVGQHDPVDAWHSRQDLGTRSRRAGVDQRHRIFVTQTYSCQP